MNSEKVKEIIKIAKSCVEKNKSHCADCSKGSEEDIVLTCRSLLKELLTIINELESENERLSSKYRNLEINYNDTWEHYREYEVENQQLKDRIAELEKENAKYKQKLTTNQWVKEIRKEALKQFTERLKEKAIRRQEFIGELAIDDIEYVKTQDIDETLKEFINESRRNDYINNEN